MEDKKNKQPGSPSVRERLAELLRHKEALRQEAASLSQAPDPVAAAQKLASVASELSATELLERQYQTLIPAEEERARVEHDEAWTKRVMSLHPQEQAAFKLVVTKTLELKAALNGWVAVCAQISGMGAGVFSPTIGSLMQAIAAVEQLWGMHPEGRQALGLPPEPTPKERALAEARDRVERLHATLDQVRQAQVDDSQPNSKSAVIKHFEKQLADAVLDVQVLEGKAKYPETPKVTQADWDKMTQQQKDAWTYQRELLSER